MRKAVVTTAVLVAAVVFFLLATSPPAPRRARWGGDPSLVARTVAGAYHVHTSRSDGTADRAGIAAAASRAGLQFVIFTDHGDGTRDPEPPAYLAGVLCLDGVEISTNGGHYAALGLPKAPYPLGGEPFAVVEDVARLGGFGFATHVDSPKAELAWTDWDAAFDGIEWMNADSEWRDEPRRHLMRTLFDYFGRPGPALASVFDRPAATLARWDAVTERRPVVALAGHDAHGGIGRGVEDGGRRGLPIPSYEASFRSFSTRVILDAPLSTDAASDGKRLLEAIRAGRVFTAVDGLAGPAYVDFTAWRGGEADRPKAEMGAVLRGRGGVLSIETSMPPGAELVLLHRGTEFKTTNRVPFVTGMEEFRGAVRAEVRVPGAPGTPAIPWIVTNPVYFLPPPAATLSEPVPAEVVPFPEDIGWHAEHDSTSRGLVATGGGRVVLDYRLGLPPKASQFVALAADMPGRIPAFDRLAFEARGSRPMRVSVQLRYGADGTGRWARSVYADPVTRTVTVRRGDLLPADGQSGPPPDPASARSMLLVIDLTNATPGTTGTLEISALRFLR